jgi:hypothetical protein
MKEPAESILNGLPLSKSEAIVNQMPAFPTGDGKVIVFPLLTL